MEEINGKKAKDWVENQNSRILKELPADSRFQKVKDFALSVYNSDKNLFYGRLINDFIYIFRKNTKHKRGIIKRTTLETYLSGKYQWEEILDIDALAEVENKNWIYKGMVVNSDTDRVLIKLSDGGGDAVILREFDLIQKNFVENGFNIPSAKSFVTWLSKNELILATDWKNEDSLTNSGYPRVVKILKRGEPLNKAVPLLKIKKTYLGVQPIQLKSEKGTQFILIAGKDFFSTEAFLLKKDKQVSKIPLPLNSKIYTHFQGRPIIKISKDWIWKDQIYKSGSFLIIHTEKMIEKEGSSVELIMEPSSNTTLLSVNSSKNKIYISILEDVKKSIIELKPHLGKWKKSKLALSSFNNLFIGSSDPNSSHVFLGSSSFLESNKIYHYNEKELF